MNNLKSIILYTIVCLSALSASAFRVGDYEYTVHTVGRFANVPEHSVSIYKYFGKEKSITLPSSVEYDGITYAVVDVYMETFSHNPIESVVIPEPIVNIGYEAFAGTKLREISLPSTLRTIESGAFDGVPVEHVICHALIPPASPVNVDGGLTNTCEVHWYSHIFGHDYWEWNIESGEPYPDPCPTEMINATVEVPELTYRLYKEKKFGTDGNVWALFTKKVVIQDKAAAMEGVETDNLLPESEDIYDINGQVVRKNAVPEDLLSLLRGIYVYKGKKIII